MKKFIFCIFLISIFGCSTSKDHSLSGKWVERNLTLDLTENNGMIEGKGEYFSDAMGDSDGKLTISGTRDGDIVTLHLKEKDFTSTCKYKYMRKYTLKSLDSETNREVDYLFDDGCLISIERKNTTLYPFLLARPEAMKKYIGFMHDFMDKGINKK